MPAREIVEGVAYLAVGTSLVDRMRRCVRDVFYVRLEGVEPAEQDAFLSWLVPQVELVNWEVLMVVPDRQTGVWADGLTTGGRIVSYRWPPGPAERPS